MAAMDPWIRENNEKLEKFLQDFAKVRFRFTKMSLQAIDTSSGKLPSIK